MATCKMIFVSGDPVFAVSNADMADDFDHHGGVVITTHYDGIMDYAGSLTHESAVFVSREQLPELITALAEFL